MSLNLTQLDSINTRIAALRTEQAAAMLAYRQMVIDHVAWLDREIAALQEQAAPSEPAFDLTERERMLIRCILSGITTGDALARTLGISERTVRTHLSHIYDKTRIPNKTELAVKFKEWWA